MLALEPWPTWDPALVQQQSVTMVVQVNGRVRDRIEVPTTVTAAEAEELALASSKVAPYLAQGTITKVVARPPNLVNLVVS